MTLSPTRRAWPLFAAFLLLLVFAAAVPRAAHAATQDSLNWSRGYSGPEDYFDGDAQVSVSGAFNAVTAPDTGFACAVGATVDHATPLGGGTKSTLIAFSFDSGQTWSQQDLTDTGFTAELHAVTSLSSGQIVAVGDGGTVALFDGFSWGVSDTVVSSLTGWSGKALRGVTFADDGFNGWAVGDGSGVLYTDDGGYTWTSIKTPSGTNALRAVVALDASHAIAVGDGGKVWKLGTTSGSVLLANSPTTNRLSGVTFTDASHGWAVGDNATFVKTANGGTSWTASPVPLPLGFLSAFGLNAHSVAFADADNGVAVGAYQMTWRTTDGGATWTPEALDDGMADTPGNLDLRGVAFAPGVWDMPVAVARRGVATYLDSTAYNKAWAFSGAWSQPDLPPTAPSGVLVGDGGGPGATIMVSWNDTSLDEDGFVVQRAKDSTNEAAFSTVATLDIDASAYIDTDVDWNSTWYYRVKSFRADLSSAYASGDGFVVDSDAPVTVSEAKGAYVDEATMTLTADDGAGSGVAHTYYTVDGAARVEGTSIDVSGDGAHEVTFWSVDAAGNVEIPQVVDFTITTLAAPDTTPPTTVSDAVDTYQDSARITLTAHDEPGGSGVASTYFALDAGDPTLGTVIDVPDPGDHTLAFWSVDAAGNAEARHSASFTVIPDTTAPTTKATVKDLATYTAAVHISLTATDGPDGSGVASTQYSLDGGDPPVDGTTLTVSALGVHTLDFWSTDNAGNVEDVQSVTFTIAKPPLPLANLTTPSTPSSVRHGSLWTCSGYLKPRHTVGSYAVTLYFYRYEKQANRTYKWVSRKTLKVKIANAYSYSKYVVKLSLPYAGKWRVRAYHADSGHRASYSSYRNLTVK